MHFVMLILSWRELVTHRMAFFCFFLMFIQPIQVLQANNNTESNRMTNVETKNGLFLLLLGIVAGRGREREMKDCQIKNGSFFVFYSFIWKVKKYQFTLERQFCSKNNILPNFQLKKDLVLFPFTMS